MTGDDTPYNPINCIDYDSLELAILHQQRLHITWHGEDGMEHIDTVMPTDLKTANHQEFLIAESSDGETLRIRLDHFISMRIDEASY
ncbi:MAG: hypothetical protein BMS9Abin26_0373 [Gammaproteobacteria bacterium]|nr:MAG: hypothetical protein BMS9Abin26_0373 [Gammaproteobacteria bacterium]